jgi:hypothetical protein
MNIFFFLGRTFLDQSLAMAKDFKARYPDASFSSFIGARSDTLDFVENYNDPEFKRIDWQSELESQWISKSLDKERLEYYRGIFGDAALQRLIISDREIGRGYVSCGQYPDTPLILALEKDDDARWNYLVRMLDYFFEAFEEDKPDFVFAYCIAASHALAMQMVAKYMNITFVQPVFPRVGSYFVLDDTVYQELTSVKHTYKKLLKGEVNCDAKIKEAESYLCEFRNKPEAPDYSKKFRNIALKNSKIISYVKIFITDIARALAIKLGLFGTKGVLRQRDGFGILKENFSVFSTSRKVLKGKIFEPYGKYKQKDYIYYPLHVDPEASTMVLAPYHTDQMAVVEAISKQMPAGKILLVKEHIPQLGKRPAYFYDRIKNMPNVHLISPFEDSYTLMKNADLTISITGTAVLEAIFINKPAMLIGNAHFTNIEGDLVVCSNISNIGEYIKKALTAEKISEDNIIKYIAAIMTEGFEYSVNDIWHDSGNHDINKYADLAKKMVDSMLRLKEVREIESAKNSGNNSSKDVVHKITA